MKEIVVKHPLIEHKLAILRDQRTGTKEFRELTSEIAAMLCYEALRDATTEEVEVQTPMEKMKAHKIDEKNYAFIPILRAGTGMVQGVITMMPNAKIGHIGLRRNEETFKAEAYYFNVPSDIEKREVFILDPMLATGGSATDAIRMLKEKGVEKISLLSIISAPEGIKKVQEDYPEVQIYTAAVDRCLNNKAYIMPGLGDAGDRVFGTN